MLGDLVTSITCRVLLPTFILIATATACGSSNDDTAIPSTLPFRETTTTVALESTTETSSAPAPSSSTMAPPQLTPEMVESMLETENGRALLTTGIASESGIEPDVAECLLDAIPVDLLVEAAGSYLEGNAELGLFSDDQMAELGPILDTCGVDPESIAP